MHPLPSARATERIWEELRYVTLRVTYVLGQRWKFFRAAVSKRAVKRKYCFNSSFRVITAGDLLDRIVGQIFPRTNCPTRNPNTTALKARRRGAARPLIAHAEHGPNIKISAAKQLERAGVRARLKTDSGRLPRKFWNSALPASKVLKKFKARALQGREREGGAGRLIRDSEMKRRHEGEEDRVEGREARAPFERSRYKDIEDETRDEKHEDTPVMCN